MESANIVNRLIGIWSKSVRFQT